MPIYEYRCSSCGHELEALQKLQRRAAHRPVLPATPPRWSSSSRPPASSSRAAAGTSPTSRAAAASRRRQGGRRRRQADAKSEAKSKRAERDQGRNQDGRREHRDTGPSSGNRSAPCLQRDALPPARAMKRYVIAGLLVWVPLGITIWVLHLLVTTLDQTLLLVPERSRPAGALRLPRSRARRRAELRRSCSSPASSPPISSASG